jgi:hypothetical protein
MALGVSLRGTRSKITTCPSVILMVCVIPHRKAKTNRYGTLAWPVSRINPSPKVIINNQMFCINMSLRWLTRSTKTPDKGIIPSDVADRTIFNFGTIPNISPTIHKSVILRAVLYFYLIPGCGRAPRPDILLSAKYTFFFK